MTKEHVRTKDKITRLFTIGALSLIGGILVGKLGPDTGGFHFAEGLLMGLSLSTNLGGLILRHMQKSVVVSKH